MTRRGTTMLTRAAICVAILSVTVGLERASAQSATQPISEHQFVPQVAMGNMAEIQLGHLALKKAQRPEVKKFAQMMIDDHLKAQNQLAEVASGANIQWPKKLDGMHQKTHQRLSSVKDDQFDREYMKAMVDGHRETEKIFTAYVGDGGAKSGASPLAGKVKPWAADTLSHVRNHLKQAEQISAGLEKGV